MEKRWSERKNLRLEVDLLQHGKKLLTCHSRDVSLGGAFLETGALSTVTAEDDYEAIFYLKNGAQPIRHQMNIRIARVTESGIGVKYHNFDTRIFRSLQEIINYKGGEAH